MRPRPWYSVELDHEPSVGERFDVVRFTGWDVDVFTGGELDGSRRIGLEHETDPTRVYAQPAPHERTDPVQGEKRRGYRPGIELRCGAGQLESGGHLTWWWHQGDSEHHAKPSAASNGITVQEWQKIFVRSVTAPSRNRSSPR